MIIMKSDKCDYYTPKCEVLEIIYEGNILTTSDQIGGGKDGEMEEGGEI